MSALAPALAGRIDRLAAHAHRFHRFAHHPLCGAYQGELVALGRRGRVCRGCAFAGLGSCAGLAAGLGGGSCAAAAFVALGLGGALAGLALIRRLPKLWGRLAPALGVGYALGAAARAWNAWSLAVMLGVVLGVAVGFASYKRRGPHRGPCATCPERLGEKPCSGLAPIVRRERAFQRLAQRWIDRGRAGVRGAAPDPRFRARPRSAAGGTPSAA